jgi:hypothetical protein
MELLGSQSKPDEALAAGVAHGRYFSKAKDLSVETACCRYVPTGYIVCNVVILKNTRSHGEIVG